ncbi:D-amino-acid dehydrogenase [Sphingomonas vulcanisoli]|uniref:D-amino acid dehydrogenase n=1 Tax=Sphingomonas vulcanisoli TaxID=1658060 RepID=A0ABX0TS12_9SPHN|nr:D-amino acid dehydrogenase [Sphingomonas vulcanisoli]NIJ08317.1 D-amino-acid dehydrogenase [Sphingomonas vulcanisoli]
MKVVVLGSGVIGVTTAYYLARAGHQVTVIDRQPGAALETSFANAGEISPGYASPWAAPGVPRKAIAWMLAKHAPLVLRLKAKPDMLVFLTRLLMNCTEERYKVNKDRMVRIAEYSRDKLIEVRAREGFHYDERALGTLQVFLTEKQVQAAHKDIEVLEREGVPYEVLDRDGCVRAEPGLDKVRDRLAGGLRLPNDETGDCFKFTNALAARCAEMGVTFRYGVETRRLVRKGGRVVAVETSEGAITADTFVVALGSYTRGMVKPLGIRLPIYPIKGYSITVPIGDLGRAPVSTIMHETYKVAITRLGDTIRVGGMAEVSGYTSTLVEGRQETLVYALEDLFPGVAKTTDVTLWSGLRPMTPDGPPIIGPTHLSNLYINSGHGTLGWTMACGSGQALADIISGKRPEIEMSDVGLR